MPQTEEMPRFHPAFETLRFICARTGQGISVARDGISFGILPSDEEKRSFTKAEGCRGSPRFNRELS
jgi:hypothetical protein